MEIESRIVGDNSDQFEVDVQRQVTPTGKLSSKLTGFIKHRGLGVEKRIVDSDSDNLQSRLEEIARKWDEEYRVVEEDKQLKRDLQLIDGILSDRVLKEVKVNWSEVMDDTPFPKEKPTFKEAKPILENTPPVPGFVDRLIKSRYIRIIEEQKKNYAILLGEWEEKRKVYEENLAQWEDEKARFEKKRADFNSEIESKRKGYDDKEPASIAWYCQVLLEQSSYPLDYEKKIITEYKQPDKLLIVEFYLPSIESIPKTKEVKYVKSRSEVREILFSERDVEAMYEDVLYKVALRTIYELFNADSAEAIDRVVLNGWVNSLNKATGKRSNACILSLMVAKDQFMGMNLANVDPEACFKRLKGVAASKLSSLVPIPPILEIDKSDRRFVGEVEVAEGLDSSSNIATMDWQEFEHLIRELFEKEYAEIGGEVKVTQSSRDRGVDAVAFDPDPIRGGKIIIQAKRYTNTVKVESVRALYGVMQDEGAMKGILVTTADFGPDAYNFVKNKPISLVNGGNLLAMIHRHGYQGRIDLSEAENLQ